MNAKKLTIILSTLVLMAGGGFLLSGQVFVQYDDPSQAELLTIVDDLLDITDQYCPVVEQTSDFRQRAANPATRVNSEKNTISLTKAGIQQAWQTSLNIVEHGSAFPNLQKAVDNQISLTQVREARDKAEASYQAFKARRDKCSPECQDLCDQYGAMLVTVDALTELALNAGQDSGFFQKYSIFRAVYIAELDNFVTGIDGLAAADAASLSAAGEASRERYLNASADYLMSPAKQLMETR